MEKVKVKFSLIVGLLLITASLFAQSGTDKVLYENAAGSGAGAYDLNALKTFINTGTGSGSVTSVSVVTANGLTGTVATATTTPAITLTTSVTGIVKGNGTAFSAATAGTDYVIPSGSITGNAATVTTNANLTGDVTSVGNAATIATGAVTSAKLATGAVDLGSNKVTGLLPNASLANAAITINGTAVSLGGTRTITLQDATTAGATTSTASTFSGGLTASGGLASSGFTTISNQFNITASSTSTGATLTLAATTPLQPIDRTVSTTVTVTAGATGNPIIELPLLSTSVGSVIINSSGSETFNGASSFTVAANSQNTTIRLRKISSTAWLASLTW